MDNLPTHKVAGVREAIEAAEAILLYLPPYSPDINPIENTISKLKAHIPSGLALQLHFLFSLCALDVGAAGFGLMGSESWPRESGQGAKWIFCLIAAKIAAMQEIL